MAPQKSEAVLEPQLCPVEQDAPGGALHVGLVGNYADTDETRMLLTPEACGMLTSAGIKITMEGGAGVDISFSDEKYSEYGVRIATRDDALKCPIVMSYQPLRAKDIRKMQRGATLLCMMGSSLFEESTVKALLQHKVTCGCFDNMLSHHDIRVFGDIVAEIDGRGAIMYAQESLSYLGGGKGVLLAGVAGLTPCEVLVIGSGTESIAAANAAAGAGAKVTMMDNDVSGLMLARQSCVPQVEAIAVHPKVLTNRVKTADVIITGNTTRPFKFPKNLSSSLKDNVYVIDLNESHPSISVPRTVAMALSNPMINFFNELAIKDGFRSMVVSTPGVQCGIVTFEGKLTDKLIGAFLGMPSVDIRMMVSTVN